MFNWQIPLLVACAVVVLVYITNRDNTNPRDKPNYLIIFTTVLVGVSGIVMFFKSDEPSVASGGAGVHTGNVHAVMKEIQLGEPDF